MNGASYGKTDGSVESGTSKNVLMHIKFAGNGFRLSVGMFVGIGVHLVSFLVLQTLMNRLIGNYLPISR